MHLLNGKGIDNFMENLSGITDGYQNYEENDCQVEIVIGASKRTGMWKLQLKIVKIAILN